MGDSSIKVVVLAFNFGTKGVFINGPGVCLRNLVKFSKHYAPNVQFSIFTTFETEDKISGARFFSIKDRAALSEEVDEADIVHCWSGLNVSYSNIIREVNRCKKPVILGPNLFDGVNISAEKRFLSKVKFNMLLAANTDLAAKLSVLHKINQSKTQGFMVGPDLDLWSPPEKVEDYILWKGNGRQKVKDIQFAKKVAKKLFGHKFIFLGERNTYNYLDHIPKASSAKLYINTSLSETMGMAQLEQMAAGVPSITHSGIFCCGEDRVTGIVSKRSIENYVEASMEILTDDNLRGQMRVGARRYVEKNFSPKNIVDQYLEVLRYAS